jgi:hypothetical protein
MATENLLAKRHLQKKILAELTESISAKRYLEKKLRVGLTESTSIRIPPPEGGAYQIRTGFDLDRVIYPVRRHLRELDHHYSRSVILLDFSLTPDKINVEVTPFVSTLRTHLYAQAPKVLMSLDDIEQAGGVTKCDKLFKELAKSVLIYRVQKRLEGE